MPTQDQLDSREKLKNFVEAFRGVMRQVGTTAKSAWFSRPNEELQGWIERGRAIDEIKDSMGYQLIAFTLEQEIERTRTQLEVGTTDDAETRGILKGLRFTKEFILTTDRSANIASGVLAGREAAIGRETTTFVRNARVEHNA